MAKPGIVLYLHVHQPYRINRYSVFDTANYHNYFNNESDNENWTNKSIFNKVADKSYRRLNPILLKLLKAHPDFKLSLSITGTFIEQAEIWAPDVLESFKQLTSTGQVEILAETYYHSLAFFYSRSEFEHQVQMHRQKIKQTFGLEPSSFRNTELAYNDDLAIWAKQAGYKAIITEGWDPVLEWRSPNYLYSPIGTEGIALLMKNYRLSDDVAFRFGDKSWPGYPLTADKYISWLESALSEKDIVNLFMDYETFGEHQWEDTGIFGFFESVIENWLDNKERTFYTVSEAAKTFKPVSEISVDHILTWADTERDLTAWNGNNLQKDALEYIYDLEKPILLTKDNRLIEDWRRLQTSDHFYYMCTKWFNDGDVHAYFSPHGSPYDAFLYYLNIVRDLRWRIYNDSKREDNNG